MKNYNWYRIHLEATCVEFNRVGNEVVIIDNPYNSVIIDVDKIE